MVCPHSDSDPDCRYSDCAVFLARALAEAKRRNLWILFAHSLNSQHCTYLQPSPKTACPSASCYPHDIIHNSSCFPSASFACGSPSCSRSARTKPPNSLLRVSQAAHLSQSRCPSAAAGRCHRRLTQSQCHRGFPLLHWRRQLRSPGDQRGPPV